jgi:PLP dependent protein
VRDIGLLQVAPRVRVVARAFFAHQAVRFCHRHAKIDYEIFGRNRVDFIFELLQPRQEFGSSLPHHTRALMRQVRGNVTVGEHGLSRSERGFDRWFGLETVARIEQRGKVRVYGRKRAEFAIEKSRDEFAEKTGIVGKADLRERHSPAVELAGECFELRAFTRAVDPFEHDELSAGRHGSDGQFSSRERLVTSASCPHARIAAMPDKTSSIAANLAHVRERIARAADRSGRRPNEVTLVAVSKTFPAEAIRAVYEGGLREFGENRVQEFEAKHAKLADFDATWHLIGHLQSNKAKRAAQLFNRVDSVDSLALAQKLDLAADDQEKRLPVLIEVHLGDEATKSGVAEADLPALADGISMLAHLDLHGLMAVPPYSEDAKRVRPYFQRLRELREELTRRLGRPLPTLSMGMSHDFEVAIEEGATEIRLGTALFGKRTAY